MEEFRLFYIYNDETKYKINVLEEQLIKLLKNVKSYVFNIQQYDCEEEEFKKMIENILNSNLLIHCLSGNYLKCLNISRIFDFAIKNNKKILSTDSLDDIMNELNNKQKIINKRYQVLNKIGNFNEIYKVKDLLEVKRVKYYSINVRRCFEKVNSIKRDLEILRSIKSPFIIKFIATFDEFINDEQIFYLVTPYYQVKIMLLYNIIDIRLGIFFLN
jgi:hypothetical protein